MKVLLLNIRLTSNSLLTRRMAFHGGEDKGVKNYNTLSYAMQYIKYSLNRNAE